MSLSFLILILSLIFSTNTILVTSGTLYKTRPGMNCSMSKPFDDTHIKNIVGQDPYTGITTAKECAKASAKLLMKTEEEMDCGEINGNTYDWEEVIKFIDTF